MLFLHETHQVAFPNLRHAATMVSRIEIELLRRIGSDPSCFRDTASSQDRLHGRS